MNTWDKMRGESAKAFQAFVFYRNMGVERSGVKTVEMLGKKPTYRSTVERWSSKHNWVARAGDYDRDLDLQAQRKHRSEVLKMRERQAKQATQMSQVLMAPFQALVKKMQRHAIEKKANPEAEDLIDMMAYDRPGDLLELAFKAATSIVSVNKAEMLARGEPTQEVNATIGVSAVEGMAPERIKSLLTGKYKEAFEQAFGDWERMAEDDDEDSTETDPSIQKEGESGSSSRGDGVQQSVYNPRTDGETGPVSTP